MYPASHTTTAVTILGNKTCNLPFYYASTCTLGVGPLQARPSIMWKASTYGKTCSFYMFWYIIVRIVPTPCYKGIEYTTQYILLYMTLCTEHYLQYFDTTAITAAVVFLLCPICTSFMRVFLDETHARGA